MLDRIAHHQSRLRTPGISLDAQGVALGSRALVLLPSLDTLVGFLALYASTTPLTDILPSLEIELVRSKLGHREITLTFAAEHVGRMDRVAGLTALAGGYLFTGTGRHFVQYRDAAAPFGYDVRELSADDAPIALYHSQFSQHYTKEKTLDLALLLARLQPRLAPAARDSEGPRWICAEAGLGPALIHYFLRSNVEAKVGIAQWPPASEFDSGPIERYIFHVEALPARMFALLQSTPGLGVFMPKGEGVAVEVGYEHPVKLQACPVFAAGGLMLLRGGDAGPLTIATLPTLGPVSAFARISMADDAASPAGGPSERIASVAVPLRLSATPGPWRDITATRVRPDELGLLRQLSYRVSRTLLEETSLALTDHGAFLLRPRGLQGFVVGTFYQAFHEAIFLPAGHSPVPSISPDVLFESFGSPADRFIFLSPKGQPIAVQKTAFVPLQRALVESLSWVDTSHEHFAEVLTTPLPTIVLGSAGYRPLRDLGSSDDHES